MSKRPPRRPVLVVLNGPNLNLLGVREPHIYGSRTLSDIETLCRTTATELGAELDFRQSNHEGQLVDWIQEVRATATGLVINPAALTHYSVSVMDALATVQGKVVEVHLSNIHRREPWRTTSYPSKVADGVIVGLGAEGYAAAIRFLLAPSRDCA